MLQRVMRLSKSQYNLSTIFNNLCLFHLKVEVSCRFFYNLTTNLKLTLVSPALVFQRVTTNTGNFHFYKWCVFGQELPVQGRGEQRPSVAKHHDMRSRPSNKNLGLSSCSPTESEPIVSRGRYKTLDLLRQYIVSVTSA